MEIQKEIIMFWFYSHVIVKILAVRVNVSLFSIKRMSNHRRSLLFPLQLKSRIVNNESNQKWLLPATGTGTHHLFFPHHRHSHHAIFFTTLRHLSLAYSALGSGYQYDSYGFWSKHMVRQCGTPCPAYVFTPHLIDLEHIWQVMDFIKSWSRWPLIVARRDIIFDLSTDQLATVKSFDPYFTIHYFTILLYPGLSMCIAHFLTIINTTIMPHGTQLTTWCTCPGSHARW